MKEGDAISEAKFEQTIKDFSYMNSRLKPLDWQSIIASGVEKWTDPHFKASKESIQDPMISKTKRILNWGIFEWRRPQ
jgi:hypothetical protein